MKPKTNREQLRKLVLIFPSQSAAATAMGYKHSAPISKMLGGSQPVRDGTVKIAHLAALDENSTKYLALMREWSE